MQSQHLSFVVIQQSKLRCIECAVSRYSHHSDASNPRVDLYEDHRLIEITEWPGEDSDDAIEEVFEKNS